MKFFLPSDPKTPEPFNSPLRTWIPKRTSESHSRNLWVGNSKLEVPGHIYREIKGRWLIFFDFQGGKNKFFVLSNIQRCLLIECRIWWIRIWGLLSPHTRSALLQPFSQRSWELLIPSDKNRLPPYQDICWSGVRYDESKYEASFDFTPQSQYYCLPFIRSWSPKLFIRATKNRNVALVGAPKRLRCIARD